MPTEWIIFAILIVAGLYAMTVYNGLVKKRQMADEGWSGIEVQLKRRANLIPNLLASVKGYMSHEKELLENITNLRSQSMAMDKAGSVTDRAKVESALGGALAKVMVVAENYPDLKANQNFIEFQTALKETEDTIQMARRYYNGAVRNLNIQVESFPANLVAQRFGFETQDYFEIEDDADRAVPNVSF